MTILSRMSRGAAVVAALSLLTSQTTLGGDVDASDEMPVKVILVPYREIVISAKVNSTVEEYKVKAGEIVAKGQLMVLLSERNYLQKKNKTEAELKKAKTRTEFTEADFKMKVQLFQRGACGRMELEEAKFNSEMAQTDYEEAMANFRLAEFDLKACRITAPFDGRVAQKIAEVHEYLRIGDPILKLINDKKLYAVIHFPSTAIDEVREGDKLNLTLFETGNSYEVEVSEVSANIDPASRTFEVRAVLDNENGRLRSGMSGQLVD